jgi:hypothetical protein
VPPSEHAASRNVKTPAADRIVSPPFSLKNHQPAIKIARGGVCAFERVAEASVVEESSNLHR